MPDRNEIAARISPLNFVTSELPPIITIHGDADPTVPYNHAKQLHSLLDRAEVTNELVTVPNGRHGGFSANEMIRIYERVFQFLDENVTR
jgi:dipeptidyl aminopeptidase/acylaminoacyl peptidase